MLLDLIRYPFLSRMRRPEGLPPDTKQDSLLRLGMRPKILFEVSLATSLTCIIGLFLFFPRFEPAKKILQTEQEIITFEEVERTRQENRPPPPPRPPIPIEAPGDETLEDIEITTTELDVTAEVAPPAPVVAEDEFASYFVAVEEMPEVVGGIESIMRRLQYPELAMRAGVQGRVYVLAYVNELGEIVRAEVQRGIGAGCDEAAVAAVKGAKFIPGKQRGKPVRVRVSIPIRFQLAGN